MLFIWWAEAWNAAKFPVMHRIAPLPASTKNCQSQMVIVLGLRNPDIMYQFMKSAVIPSSHPLICSSLVNYTRLCPHISLHSSARIVVKIPAGRATIVA